jgi:hypothetical protein
VMPPSIQATAAGRCSIRTDACSVSSARKSLHDVRRHGVRGSTNLAA